MAMLARAVGPTAAVRTAARLLAELAGFAVLLFVARFVARGHLVPHMDQECFIGGIALDVLAHGVRFPLLAYAPNEYDNGSFFSGLLAAGSFSLFGRSLLALKLVTHVITAAGAVAALWLLRGCLDELELRDRRLRWTATALLLVAFAFAPRPVVLVSTYAVGNHAEGTAINTILLALFARRLHSGSAIRTAVFWALVGGALYLNKGTFLVIPVLAAAEIVLAWPAVGRLVAAAAGFLTGLLPELLVVAQRRGAGWATMASKGERYAQGFPLAFFDDIATLGEHRVELLGLWGFAVIAAVALLRGSLRSGKWRRSDASRRADRAGVGPPVTLGLVVAVTLLHLAVLTVVAQGGIDAYATYSAPALAVLVAAVLAWAAAGVVSRWGTGVAAPAAVAAIVLVLIAYRPDAMTWSLAAAQALHRNQQGAACSWRFAEGFMREGEYGLAPPGVASEQYAIARCRTLSEADQRLDCIGGIARELNWRRGGRVAGTPPAALSPAEARVYAFHYGTHRNGDVTPCRDFTDAALGADCVAAVQLECLVFGDVLTRYATGHGIGRPHCDIPAPPSNGYWSAAHADLLDRPRGGGPDLTAVPGGDALAPCQPIFDACFESKG